jgi:hypothetical protein
VRPFPGHISGRKLRTRQLLLRRELRVKGKYGTSLCTKMYTKEERMVPREKIIFLR